MCCKKQPKRLGLTANSDKSKVVVFRKGGFLGAREKWIFNGNKLEVVNSYRYLGRTFSTRLSFSAAVEDVAVRANKKYYRNSCYVKHN